MQWEYHVTYLDASARIHEELDDGAQRLGTRRGHAASVEGNKIGLARDLQAAEGRGIGPAR
jgi:hypothetical protein